MTKEYLTSAQQSVDGVPIEESDFLALKSAVVQSLHRKRILTRLKAQLLFSVLESGNEGDDGLLQRRLGNTNCRNYVETELGHNTVKLVGELLNSLGLHQSRKMLELECGVPLAVSKPIQPENTQLAKLVSRQMSAGHATEAEASMLSNGVSAPVETSSIVPGKEEALRAAEDSVNPEVSVISDFLFDEASKPFDKIVAMQLP